MKRIHLYFRTPPPNDRLLPGDRHLFVLLKKLLKKERTSGLKKVFVNLVKGFDELGLDYDINCSFKKIMPGESVVVLGDGKYALQGYDKSNKIIAGIGLMTNPAEWPDVFEQYPVAVYLQHSEWAKNIYARAFGAERCGIWPAGIDSDKWAPGKKNKNIDVLVYDKIMWNKEHTRLNLKAPVLDRLKSLGLAYREISYGSYTEEEYRTLLEQSSAMIYLCEHESQGFALCEALSMDVPVLVWDQGFWLDPNRLKWGEVEPVPATSAPCFDERCGMRFKDIAEFDGTFDEFWTKAKKHAFKPRDYVLENLTLKKSAQKMLEIITSIYP
ncbi:MAG: glycosyltransferase [Bacteroidetes bacterium]|nr:glycosyltransferase [Bacteroidota bacterium]